MKNKIGILGGMGPDATLYTYEELIKINKTINPGTFTPHIIINSIPHDNIFENLNDAISKEILKGILDLIKLDVNKIGISCNTAHIYSHQFREILNALDVKFIHLIEEAAIYCSKKNFKRIGLLSTPTSKELYREEFIKFNIECIFPHDNVQNMVNKLINKVLDHNNGIEDANYIIEISKEMIREHDLDVIILGCTELPILFKNVKQPDFCLSSISVLAQALLKK